MSFGHFLEGPPAKAAAVRQNSSTTKRALSRNRALDLITASTVIRNPAAGMRTKIQSYQLASFEIGSEADGMFRKTAFRESLSLYLGFLVPFVAIRKQPTSNTVIVTSIGCAQNATSRDVGGGRFRLVVVANTNT